LFQDDAECFAVDRAFNANAHTAQFDLDDASILTKCPGPVIDYFRDAHRHQLHRSRVYIQMAFAQQFSPMKHLVGIDPMTPRHDRHRSAWLQRFFGNLPPLLFRTMTPGRLLNGVNFCLTVSDYSHLPQRPQAASRMNEILCRPTGGIHRLSITHKSEVVLAVLLILRCEFSPSDLLETNKMMATWRNNIGTKCFSMASVILQSPRPRGGWIGK
jgi:hypothetical protein